MIDKAEEAYWRFDARRKGYGEWKETPQSERDAFKAEYSDLQSHTRTLLAVVERMEHSELCPANYCIKPAITGDECCQIEHAHRRIPDHAFQGGPCSCPLGELRRGLEVML